MGKQLTQNAIALKYRKSIVLDASGVKIKPEVTTLAIEMVNLGFAPSKELTRALSTLSKAKLKKLAEGLIEDLRALKGADVKYVPMYPNFPEQVAQASDLELYLNAFVHYWTFGEWSPDYVTLPRQKGDETVKLIDVSVITSEQFDEIFTQLISSNESLSDADKETVRWFLTNDYKVTGPVSYKETACFIACELLKQGRSISPLVTNATDVLRVATALSGGDISLAVDTKFKSQPRSIRRVLAAELNRVASEEDINRYRGKWAVLFHNLHIGEYASKRLHTIVNKVRNNERIETFNSQVQAWLNAGDIEEAVSLLKNRPGEFARRLDYLLRSDEDTQKLVLRTFKAIAPKLPTRILLQLAGHMKTRASDTANRIVFPKGSVQRAMLIDGLPALDGTVLLKIRAVIDTALKTRFGGLETLGKVYIDPALKDCPIPTQQRSASEGLYQVARGTRLPIGDDKTTLRFFIYWVGMDIDLSATFHNENFDLVDHVSYMNLRSGSMKAYHSGDIVRAPNGACEFIDLDIESAAKKARYVAMQVRVFNGGTFKEHDTCYAGWMTREKPNSGEIFDAKFVDQKIDVRTESRASIPMIFDLVERTVIWADMSTESNSFGGYDYGYGHRFGGNNVLNNKASTGQTMKALVTNENKVSLYELFELHAKARGKITENRDKADVVFTLTDAYDITRINSEFVV